MPVLIFHLKDVPDDEAEDVRALLREARIEFYETAGGTVALALGLSTPAIWLRDDDDRDRARALIDAYQSDRRARAVDAGGESFSERARARPLQILLAALLIAVVLYFSIRPFFF